MMRAMSTRNDDPAGASRPFDKDRDGFVFGEAAAMLILIRCAPIRIGNLAAIGYKGRKRWLSAPPKGGLALLHIPARYVKSRKEIRAGLQNDGKKNSWSLISWYLDYIGPAS